MEASPVEIEIIIRIGILEKYRGVGAPPPFKKFLYMLFLPYTT